MPDILEQLYCSQQIHIPPTFPSILKLYAKAAIRTQPYDLLKWSAAYFRALAEGEEPPVKQRIEYPPVTTSSGLSPGYLKILIKQLGKSGIVQVSILVKKWEGICLNVDALHNMLKIGEFEDEVDWSKFIAIATGHLTKTLTQTMYLLCELLTEEPEGGNDMIPLEMFRELYTYLARLNCGTPEDEIPENEEIAEQVHRKTTLEKVQEEENENQTTPQELEQQEMDTETENAGEETVYEVEPEEENTSARRDEGVQTSEEEIANTQGGELQKLIPQEAIHVPGIGPVLPRRQIQSVMNYMEYWAERQAGMVMPRNIHHFLCPPLDKQPIPASDEH